MTTGAGQETSSIGLSAAAVVGRRARVKMAPRARARIVTGSLLFYLARERASLL
jgi:hypothetical protein